MAEITDDDARRLRRAWFDYLDTIEPLRKDLHAYGMRLSGNVWDAEDLVQETLLKGYAMIGRGDLHGPGSPVENPRAYLFRAATNLWLDGQRRRARERSILAEPSGDTPPTGPDATRAAAEILLAASPQARAAVLLKDVFGFTLEEIADQLRTTVGGVKAALSRGRASVQAATAGDAQAGERPSRELVDRFVDAFNAHDAARLAALLTETCAIEVPGVGGGRGRRGGWAEASARNTGGRYEAGVYQGEPVVLAFADTPEGARLVDVMRIEEADGLAVAVRNHCFCPDTIAHIAGELGLVAAPWGYHQPPEVLTGMIATTTLPWGSKGMTHHAP